MEEIVGKSLDANALLPWTKARMLAGETVVMPTVDILPDLLRFNEAIDQVMTESLARFTQKFTHSGGLFVGTLVNDFRDPLAAVHDSAHELLMRGRLDDEQVKQVSRIETSWTRACRLCPLP